MLNWLKETTASTRAAMATEISKFQNRKFMDAVVASCVLLAAADGSIDAAEKAKMMGFVKRSDELKAFDPKDVIDTFNKLADNFDFDFQIGQMEALKVINKIKGQDDQARMVVRLAIIIGGSDGNFDDDEKKAARTICTELGLNPADFDL